MKTYFVDTNYFLRLLLSDDQQQHKVVYDLFQRAIQRKVRLLTTIIVFFEINWVLYSVYGKNKEELVYMLEKVLSMSFVDWQQKELLLAALEIFKKQNLDLEDCYNIVFASEIKTEFATFDKQIIRYLKK